MEYEVLKVQIPKDLAEKFRKWVAMKYGFKKGMLSKAVEDLIKKALNKETREFNINNLIGLLKNKRIKDKDLSEIALEVIKND